MFLFNLILAFRNLVKNRLYALLTITGFTFGFMIFFLILVYILQEKTVDHSFKNHKNIYRLIAGGTKCNLNYEFSSILKENFPEIVHSCPVNIINGFDSQIKYGEKAASLNGLISTNNDFFEIFSLNSIKRVSDEIFTDINSIVLTRSLAETLFADSDPLGKEINFLGSFNAKVSAVVEDFNENTSIKASAFVNIENEKFRFSKSCHNNNCIYLTNHFIELKRGTDSKRLSFKMNNQAGIFPTTVVNPGLQNLKEIYLSGNIEGNRNRQGNKSLLNVMIAVAVLILILSIINQLNFNLSLQLSRLKSIHLRKIYGANTWNLAAYLLIEVSLSIAVSLFLAYEFSAIVLPFAGQLTGMSMNTNMLHSSLFIITDIDNLYHGHSHTFNRPPLFPVRIQAEILV